MSNKNVELNAAKEKLVKLIDDLNESEIRLEEALQYAASYLGYDERIEQARDDRAKDALDECSTIKQEVANQIKLMGELVNK
ncbi:TPA: hypothetical protein ACF3VG_001256 [Klebsiella pneumoniae]|uniref:hypothetical protein n=1 Tax=Klebsiella TaxID=570 RepID=UPI000DD38AAE|nr:MULTISPECIES: hypothetical protein [Klebsiella]HCM6450227.1 hypothetical protein [Klebsiella pneumoniae]HDT5879444.1 hypothetical protein [Klebsiella quasipneumoniae subsp. similipneumoniae]HDT5922415.1 hypothetical protein [Klebsiella pneumoniae subsp. pneumoniae]MCW9480894.1 hypothetical protein [Klebsiella oxytoca]HDY8682608.1 hypothetical protein [Klebsiella pneumoniae]